MQTLYTDIANHADAIEVIESLEEARFISHVHGFDITGKFDDDGDFHVISTEKQSRFTEDQLGDIIRIAADYINEQDFINFHGFSL